MELNGEVDTVDSVDYSECRYLAKMPNEHIKSVKGTNNMEEMLPKASRFLYITHEIVGCIRTVAPA